MAGTTWHTLLHLKLVFRCSFQITFYYISIRWRFYPERLTLILHLHTVQTQLQGAIHYLYTHTADLLPPPRAPPLPQWQHVCLLLKDAICCLQTGAGRCDRHWPDGGDRGSVTVFDVDPSRLPVQFLGRRHWLHRRDKVLLQLVTVSQFLRAEDSVISITRIPRSLVHRGNM